MQALMKATPDDAALLIVGDIDQQPSVGPGQVLADIIGSGVVPVKVLILQGLRRVAKSSLGLQSSLAAPSTLISKINGL
jgi:exodeoxyribonuclease V alpha subunit